MSRRRITWILVAVVALAFCLRLYRLDSVPLRGDEGFAVRYWADDPVSVTRHLAATEPHPLLTFYAFYSWKQIAGSSVFAMRYLPLLGSLLGVVAVAAIARQLFNDHRVTALAAVLWAMQPFAIWHAQDVRNYAIWSGLSPLALLFFMRAVRSGRPRHWVAYVFAAGAALHSFFLEAFLLPVHGLYLILVQRDRRAAGRALLAWSALLLLLIPWLLQAWYLSQSNYAGATQEASLERLATWILPTLIAGAVPGAPWAAVLSLGWLLVAAVGLGLTQADLRLWAWLVAWIAVPVLLLFIAATRMSVFHPRYLIAIGPAFAIITARVVIPTPGTRRPGRRGPSRAMLVLALLAPLYGVSALPDYYRGVNAKAPDWPALAEYLEARVRRTDLIVQNAPDPAFGYYYRGPADETALLPGIDVAAKLRPELNFYAAIWLIGRSPEAEAFLADRLQLVSAHTVARFSVMQFRPKSPRASEIATSSNALFREPGGEPVVRLKGFTIQGPDRVSSAISVLLYWEPLRQTATDYTVFVHLIGGMNPATGTPLWDQDDHPPLDGLAPTTGWEPGVTFRDAFNLLEDPALRLPPGSYALQVGLYDPVSGTRLIAEAPEGTIIGDSLPLLALEFPTK